MNDHIYIWFHKLFIKYFKKKKHKLHILQKSRFQTIADMPISTNSSEVSLKHSEENTERRFEVYVGLYIQYLVQYLAHSWWSINISKLNKQSKNKLCRVSMVWWEEQN